MADQSPSFSNPGDRSPAYPLLAVGESFLISPLVEDRPEYSDFGGLDSEINILKDIGLIFSNPEAAELWDVNIPTGLLLYGPGGVGKSELVRAFSREIDAKLIEINTSDIQSKWVGDSAKNLRKAFETAKKSVGRVVLFFGEFDGLFSRNAGGNSGANNSLTCEMKSIMSNVRREQPNTIVAASTNSLSGFDEALLRAGRFDVVLQIAKPNDAARANIFGTLIFDHLDLYELGDSKGGKRDGATVDFDSLAGATDGMTGADIKAILHTARTKRMLSGLRQGTPLTPITQQEILQAVRQHRQQRINAAD